MKIFYTNSYFIQMNNNYSDENLNINLNNNEWKYLLENTDIIFEKNSCPLFIIKKYPNRFNWNYMIYNEKINKNFILKYDYQNWNIPEIIEKKILNFKQLSRLKNINNIILNEYYNKKWDYKYLLENTDITFEKNSCSPYFINKYPNRFNWNYMIYNEKINKNFILKYDYQNWNIPEIIEKKILNFKQLSRLKNINNIILNEYYNKKWDYKYLLENTDITFEKNSCSPYFINKYPNRFNWNYMIYNILITTTFILNNKNKDWDITKLIEKTEISFKDLSRFKNFNKNFINTYNKNDLDYKYLLENTNIIFDINCCPLYLINKYPDRFYWFYMYCYNEYINEHFILKHIDKNWDIKTIIDENVMNMKKISKFKKIDTQIINLHYLKKWDWKYLLLYKKNIIFEKNSCPKYLINKYPNRFNWYYMHTNQNITKNFIIKHKDKNWNMYEISCKIPFKKLSEFKYINKDIIHYFYLKKWDWQYLLTNTNIIFDSNVAPLNLIKKYVDRFNWHYMINNHNVNRKFILKYLDKNWNIEKIIKKNILSSDEVSILFKI